LAAAVCTRGIQLLIILFSIFFSLKDLNTALKFADELQAGTVWVNTYHTITAQG
jgi:acyl-CoA reductase-like NAD-dependent aldehyde dehydrogenase